MRSLHGMRSGGPAKSKTWRMSNARMVSAAADCAWAAATARLRGMPPESAALLPSATPSCPAK
eukprot:9181908-Alexandrium_andersonii.AAC.1